MEGYLAFDLEYPRQIICAIKQNDNDGTVIHGVRGNGERVVRLTRSILRDSFLKFRGTSEMSLKDYLEGHETNNKQLSTSVFILFEFTELIDE